MEEITRETITRVVPGIRGEFYVRVVIIFLFFATAPVTYVVKASWIKSKIRAVLVVLLISCIVSVSWAYWLTYGSSSSLREGTNQSTTEQTISTQTMLITLKPTATPTLTLRPTPSPTPTPVATPYIAPLRFVLTDFPNTGGPYSVYSAPSTASWRGKGSKGFAEVGTYGDIWVAGKTSNGWLLIYYETMDDSIRVGYIDGNAISGYVSVNTRLDFAYAEAQITQRCTLTDDLRRRVGITTLSSGTKVTYLAPYGDDWAYVETTHDNKTIRAFVPMNCLEIYW